LSIITKPDFKSHVGKKNSGTPNDVIFLMPLRLSCPFGKKSGPKKIHKNLWCFQYHLKKYHFDSDDNKRKSIRYIELLYELISKEVLR